MPVDNKKNEQLCNTQSVSIPWEKYESLGSNIRNGLSPEEYVRNLREQDHDVVPFDAFTH